MRIALLGILLAALLPVSGCSRPEREHSDIIQTLTTRANAINSRNVPRYLSVVSIRYSDKGKTFAHLRESLEKNFRDFEQISYEPGTPAITVDGTTADTACSYRMKIQVRGKEMTLNGTEHLRLSKEPEGWKIIAGI
ncbi:MAG: nuclear transport factor 2 family protein [Desulfuromonadaceae bacterium]